MKSLLPRAPTCGEDLKALYVNLAVARLRLGHYDEAWAAFRTGFGS